MAAVLISVLLATKPAYAKTFTVNESGDENDRDFLGGTFDGSSDGKCFIGGLSTVGDECTLRAAIQTANQYPGADTIAFDIPGSGVHNISPGSSLPDITKPVTIDGYTQGGAIGNEQPANAGILAALKIELDGTSAGTNADGLKIEDASNVVVRGLVINNFARAGIVISGGTGHRVEGNFIGTDWTGIDTGDPLGEGNGQEGVVLDNTDNSTIGGTSPEDRHLISNNGADGVEISSGSSGNKVIGNLIGTDTNGTSDLRNGFSGVDIIFSSNNTIGDSDPSDGPTNAANTIAFNGQGGFVSFPVLTCSERATASSVTPSSLTAGWV